MYYFNLVLLKAILSSLQLNTSTIQISYSTLTKLSYISPKLFVSICNGPSCAYPSSLSSVSCSAPRSDFPRCSFEPSSPASSPHFDFTPAQFSSTGTHSTVMMTKESHFQHGTGAVHQCSSVHQNSSPSVSYICRITARDGLSRQRMRFRDTYC